MGGSSRNGGVKGLKEVLKVHEFFTEPLSMKGKYAARNCQ